MTRRPGGLRPMRGIRVYGYTTFVLGMLVVWGLPTYAYGLDLINLQPATVTVTEYVEPSGRNGGNYAEGTWRLPDGKTYEGQVNGADRGMVGTTFDGFGTDSMAATDRGTVILPAVFAYGVATLFTAAIGYGVVRGLSRARRYRRAAGG